MKKAFMMTIALLCAVAQGAWAESVTFNVRSWDATTKQVVTTATTKDCTVLTGDHSEEWMMLGSSSDQNDHYYVVKGSVSYQTLNVYGKAHLILADNATLTCTGGIKVEQGNSYGKLFVYSQSDGDKEGRLVVTNSYDGAAGIGSAEGRNSGPINIYGGRLDITGGKYAAGIGAGKGTKDVSTRINGGVFIYGGTVVAHGGDSGAGIGGGAEYYTNGKRYFDNVYLYGGTVTATGGNLAAGVGGGGAYASTGIDKAHNGGAGHYVYVYGGTLTAQGGRRGAGIGSGSFHDYLTELYGGTLNVYAGTVNATGGAYGAGIGGGCNANGGTVNVSGGIVRAKGGTDAAGIGGGEDGNGGTVNVSGGIVRAEGTSYGAGIGGGEYTTTSTIAYRGKGASVTITGGTVIAIAGGDCKGRQAKGGSAIGCGQGVSDKDASDNVGTLSLAANYRVTAGDAENDIERVFTSSERIDACRWRNYVKIEACDHKTPTEGSDQARAVSYTVDSDTHTMHCRYCAYTLQENHTYADDVCTYCLKAGNTHDDLWVVTLYRAPAANIDRYDESEVMNVVKGQSFTVPAVQATEGLTLMGYATSTLGLSSFEMKDGETLTAVGAVVTPDANTTYYPRYRYRYEPTWTWNDADATATLTITCSALSSTAVSVDNIEYTTDGEVKTATGTYEHNGATYTFTDTYLLPVDETIALLNNASNEATLDTYGGRKVKSVMLNGRTLYVDGSWNTLCLPFDISEADLNTKLFNPSALKTLSGSDYDSETGTLTLNFADATSIEAGRPYLIKWTRSGEWTNPIFNYVTISDNQKTATTDYVDFYGFFSPVSLEADDRNVLYLGADNTLYYPSADMTVGSCRAVFKLNGITAGDLASGANARRFVLNFFDEQSGEAERGDGDETTGIISIDNGQLIIDNSMDAWYTLDGRRLTGKPTAKGLYINNGRKVVIK
ncbi:MAG: hypothetical protein II864_08035 [Prevotella sp.]|nr:hypothetical protein [Prevotella sp.]MBQ3787413.1 hypothetical protein [Bacteroidales bacterium]